MPTRYSLRVRPIYGENEPTTAESINSVLQGFIARKMQSDEENRQWENQVAEHGGQVTQQAPSFGDNIRRVGRGVASLLGRGPRATPGDIRQGMVDRQVRPVQLPVGVTPWNPNGATQGANGAWTIGGEEPPPGTMPMLGDANPRNASATDADFYVQKGPHGQVARIPKYDPMASSQEMAKLRYKDILDRSRYAYEQDIAHKNRLEEIRATPRSASVDPDEWDRRQRISHQYDMEEIGARESAADRRARMRQNDPDGSDVRAAKSAERQELLATIQAARANIPSDDIELRRSMNDPAKAQAIRAAQATIQEASRRLNQLAGLPDPGEVEMRARRTTATPQTMKLRMQFLTNEARRQYPKATEEQIKRAVRNTMREEGWPIQ